MADKYMNSVEIIRTEHLAEGIYGMWIKDQKIAEQSVPGQFISLYCRDGSRLLPRPISICETDKKNGTIRLVYRVAGKGTEEFSAMKEGDTLTVMGPLGNGFKQEGTKALIIGGGIGIPPMLELAKSLKCEKQIVLGYRDVVFLQEEMQEYGTVYISTEDGSSGMKGNVIDVIEKQELEADIIYACGPTPMLRGIKEYAAKHGIKAQLSMEERMACGIGACLACVCKTGEKDSHSNVKNKRICKEGPVFYATEVELS